MKYTCPVCGFDGLEEPPVNFTICPSCGTEFGYTDFIRSHDDLRARWITKGLQWYSNVIPPPPQWNGWEQLRRSGHITYSPAAEGTQSEVGVVESTGQPTIVNIFVGSMRVTMDNGVGRIISHLFDRMKFAPATQS